MSKTVEQLKETIKKARKILNKAEKNRDASFDESEYNEYDVEDYVVEVQEALKVLRCGK